VLIRAVSQFGDDDDDEGEGTRSRVLSSSAPTEASRSRSPNPLEYAEEDIELEEADENWANLPVPQWPHMQATDGKVRRGFEPTTPHTLPSPHLYPSCCTIPQLLLLPESLPSGRRYSLI
jgi:hypothetical protein